MDVNIGNNNKIILIINNNYAKDLTIKFIDYWNKQKSNTDLKIFDLNNFTINNIGNNLVKKYSDKGFRWIKSHEYTQMAGRAGRRGIDTLGNVIHLTNFYAIQENNFPGSQTMRTILSGKPSSMQSKFKINANIILKLISVGNNNFEKSFGFTHCNGSRNTGIVKLYYFDRNISI